MPVVSRALFLEDITTPCSTCHPWPQTGNRSWIPAVSTQWWWPLASHHLRMCRAEGKLQKTEKLWQSDQMSSQNSQEIWVREDGILKYLKVNFQSDKLKGEIIYRGKGWHCVPGTFEETHFQVLWNITL